MRGERIEGVDELSFFRFKGVAVEGHGVAAALLAVLGAKLA
jgi:hypothetical protein